MRLLILSFYYPPDLGAGSFRMKALVEALSAYRDRGLTIDVLTTAPNRYKSRAEAAPPFEDQGWLRIRRIGLKQHLSGRLDQSRAFASFAQGAMRHLNKQNYDAVFVTSSRLMTAALGAAIAQHRKLPLYLDIRDLFTDTMTDLLGSSKVRFLMPFFRTLERWTFGRASRINMVSPSFAPHISSVAPKAELRFFTNGIDDEFIRNDWHGSTDQGRDSLPLITYAGNIGDGQGLHNVLPEAIGQLSGKARFRILGDGGRITELRAALSPKLSNVELLPPVSRADLIEHYRASDILFLHLNDHEAFEKVLPSKIFEYAATGKPIVAGVSGHSAKFLREQVPGAEVFQPCNSAEMISAVESALKLQPHIDRKKFIAEHARTSIMKAMADDIMEFATRY